MSALLGPYATIDWRRNSLVGRTGNLLWKTGSPTQTRGNGGDFHRRGEWLPGDDSPAHRADAYQVRCRPDRLANYEGKSLDQERRNPSMRSAVAPEVSHSQGGAMRLTPIMPMVLTSFVVGAPMASAEVLNTHRIPAVLAVEAASESIGACAKQGYLETAVVVDADGATRR
jgi:hypothetical protein